VGGGLKGGGVRARAGLGGGGQGGQTDGEEAEEAETSSSLRRDVDWLLENDVAVISKPGVESADEVFASNLTLALGAAAAAFVGYIILSVGWLLFSVTFLAAKYGVVAIALLFFISFLT